MEPHQEKMELSHDAVPGYKPVFKVVFTLSLVYLAIVFISSAF